MHRQQKLLGWRAAACLLFARWPWLSMARPFVSTVKHYNYITAVLPRYSDMLTLHRYRKWHHVLWVGTHYPCWWAMITIFFRSLCSKSCLATSVVWLNQLFIWSTHFSDASASYGQMHRFLRALVCSGDWNAIWDVDLWDPRNWMVTCIPHRRSTLWEEAYLGLPR